jgi:hypothetical protein
MNHQATVKGPNGTTSPFNAEPGSACSGAKAIIHFQKGPAQITSLKRNQYHSVASGNAGVYKEVS